MLSEAQYLTLCDTCDAILQAPDASEACIAIPWLHVIREHPVFLEQYATLFVEPDSGQRSGLSLRGLARFLIDRVHAIAAAANVRESRNLPPTDPAGALDVLFVSHLLNEASAGKDDDFYFADWPRQLAQRGYASAVALINHTSSAVSALSAWPADAVRRMVFAPTLDVRGELRLALRVASESLRLRRLSARTNHPLARRVLARASVEALSPTTIAVLRIGAQIRALARGHAPRAIVLTHEGHAWERIVLGAVRQATPGVVGVAYQHALLFRLQHAVLRLLGPAYDPTAVLTSGEAATERFVAAFRDRGIRVATAGTRRAPAAAGEGMRTADGSNCLVLPEGIASECDLLFTFSLECARLSPKTTFIWRLHPIISFKSLLARNPSLAARPSNVVLSTGSLEDDIAASAWTLYRGSTAVVQAVSAGVRPIYLRRAGEMTIDPLFSATRGVHRVERPDEVTRLLAAPSASGSESGDASNLAALCRHLFAPSDISTLVAMLPAPRSATPTGHSA